MADEPELIEAWRGGDRSAGETLIERYYDAIARFFANKAGASADDLTQKTFLRCASSLQRLRSDGSFRAFLFGIARNTLYEHYRRRVRDARVEPDFNTNSIADLAPGVATLVGQKAEQRVLGLALQHIPLEMQVLLELYYWEDLRLAELAEMLDIPTGTVKSRLHRARELLREAMAKVPSSPEERNSASELLARWASGIKKSS